MEIKKYPVTLTVETLAPEEVFERFKTVKNEHMIELVRAHSRQCQLEAEIAHFATGSYLVKLRALEGSQWAS